MVLLLDRLLLMQALQCAWQFHQEQLQKFSLKLVLVLEHKEPKDQLHQHQQQLKQAHDYAWQYMKGQEQQLP